MHEVNPAIPRVLSDLITQLLAKDPAGRPDSARDVIEAIQAIEREQPAAGATGAAATNPAASRKDSTPSITQDYVPQRSWRRPLLLLGAAAAGLLFLLVAGGVIFVQTDKATLKIETADADVQVIVEQNGKVVAVIDRKTGREVKLRSGEYTLKLGEENKDVRIDKGVIQLTRGDTVVATITRVAAPPLDKQLAMLAGEWNITYSHGATREYTIHKDGRVSCPELNLEGKIQRKDDRLVLIFADAGSLEGLTLRADGRLFVDHYNPAAKYPGAPTHTGLGIRILRNDLIVQRFRGHTLLVRAVAHSSDGKRVVTGSADKTAILWDAASGKKLQTFPGHTGEIWSVALSGDGKLVVTGSVDRTAILWDAASGKKHPDLPRHADGSRAWP